MCCAGVWIWLAVMNRKGDFRARLLTTALGGLYIATAAGLLVLQPASSPALSGPLRCCR